MGCVDQLESEMSYHEYKVSQIIAIEDYPFYALIMACMRQADTDNAELLRETWPRVWEELDARYHQPGGLLLSEGALRQSLAQQEKEDD